MNSRELVAYLDGVYLELKTVAPAFWELRPPGCQLEALLALEAAAGSALPGLVREALLHQNGSGVSHQIGRSPWLSVEDSLAFLRMTLADDIPPRDNVGVGVREGVGWAQGWIPLSLFPNGDMFVLDMEPGAGGVPGQVLIWDHDVVSPKVAFADFSEFAVEQLDVVAFEEMQDLVDAGVFEGPPDDEEVEFDEFEPFELG